MDFIPFYKMNIQEYEKKRRYLSARLIEAREVAGFTQEQVAETDIISQSELSKIENGSRKVDFIFLQELAKLYEKPIDFFSL
jgi:transcriptional regulator with XRE-family HTH domain